MTSTPQPPPHDDGNGNDATSTRPTLPRRPTAKIKEALAARDALATALTRAGIQIPAMDVRTPWPDDDNDGDRQAHTSNRAAETRYALVHLGVVSAPVAHALADVITRGAAQ
ncbi:hypothetical protein [Streptomyces sp. NPDC048361]|uniref:hypothetical protein n=1 Tax=Streptomyces sp. NPDC048361 TaxID=3154720 RepID=UPI003419DF80